MIDSSSVKSFLVNYASAIGGILTLVGGGVVVGLGRLEPEFLLPYLSAGLGLIAFNALIQSHLRQEERESILAIKNLIENKALPKIRSIEPPRSNVDNYIKIWGGFESHEYRAFNPSFTIEPILAENDQRRVINSVFVPRYKNQNFEGRYLFFLRKEKDEDLEEFVRNMNKVRKHCEMGDRLHIRVLRGEYTEHRSEFYIGKQKGRETCIIKPRNGDVFSNKQGNPDCYFITNDHYMCEKYRQLFDTDWVRGTKISLEDLIKEYEVA